MIEYRALTGAADVAVSDGVIGGLAIPYNRETQIGDPKWGFREQIAPGACTKSIQEADIVALYNHRSELPLGRTSAGNLTLNDSDRGISPELTPTDTTYARDLRTNIKAGVVRGWSFGFEVTKDAWTNEAGDPSDSLNGTRRTIREMKLIEVSPVTFPAYDMTDISARDIRKAGKEKRAPKPYGNVTYADPKNGKYPIDTLKHVKAAWAFINKAKNAAVYPLNGVTLSSVKAAIKAACAKFGITINDQNEAQLAIEWREAIDLKRAEKRIKAEIAKRVPQINAQLNQACAEFSKCNVSKLPTHAQNGIVFVTSAATHAGHIMSHTKLGPQDALREMPKPEESTLAGTEDEDCTRRATALSRSIQFGKKVKLSAAKADVPTEDVE